MDAAARLPFHRKLVITIARRIPPVLLNEPWAIFVKSLCVASGSATLAGPPPGSLEDNLPRAMVTLWSITLICGGLAGLIGLLSSTRRLEVAGLVWLGTAALVYAAAVLVTRGFVAAFAGSMVLAFGLAALTRALAVYASYELARYRAEQR